VESDSRFKLAQYFELLNRQHFEGLLALPILRWNARLRTSAGRFIPGGRQLFSASPPIIEIASYLKHEAEGEKLIVDTLGHEMIHYWLWMRRRPYGHGAEFWTKMKLMGVSRYNPVPKRRNFKYVYQCGACAKEFPARRRLKALACAACCKAYNGGRYDKKYKLIFRRELAPGEAPTGAASSPPSEPPAEAKNR
jgi:predicted SprT family Zn-dependent metalloprotease